jgi:hypothetical protein
MINNYLAHDALLSLDWALLRIRVLVTLYFVAVRQPSTLHLISIIVGTGHCVKGRGAWLFRTGQWVFGRGCGRSLLYLFM